MKIIFSILGMLIFPMVMFTQDNNIYEARTFNLQGHTLPYRILYPKRYDKAKAYPVITLLHGIGERGSDNQAQLLHGGSLFTGEAFRSNHEAIVIFPQCAYDSTWSRIASKPDTSSITGQQIDFTFSARPTTPSRLVKILLDSLVKAGVADSRRMYLMGLSLGGFGTLDMIARYPGFFAAAVCICGGGDTKAAARVAKNGALWMFHGAKDKTVDVRYSRQYYREVRNARGDARYTEYPDAGHGCWNRVFAEKDLMPWIFSKVRQ